MIINKFRQFRQDHILIFGQFTSAAAAAAESSCHAHFDTIQFTKRSSGEQQQQSTGTKSRPINPFIQVVKDDHQSVSSSNGGSGKGQRSATIFI